MLLKPFFFFSNNRIGLLATQKLALGIAAHPNLKVLKVLTQRSFTLE